MGPNTTELLNGLSRASHSRSGLQQDRYYGSTESVCLFSSQLTTFSDTLLAIWSRSRFRKDCPLVCATASPWICSTFMSPTSSTIIQQVKTKCDRGLALMGYYYFDFKDIAKQGIRGLLTSLLSQFCATSDPCYQILFDLYFENHEGSQQPSDKTLMESLTKILRLPDAPMRCIIMDAIDECPNTSGFPTPREEILEFLEDLVGLNLPNLRICVTSRPEMDIQTVLEPLTSLHMSLHDQSGQKQDIIDYINNVVHSDRQMRRWRPEDKQMVIDTLSKKADGM